MQSTTPRRSTRAIPILVLVLAVAAALLVAARPAEAVPDTQLAILTAEDPTDNDSFGRAVAVDGDTIVVGVPSDDDNGDDSGAVYVFQPQDGGGYTHTKLIAGDGAAGDSFGSSVAIDGGVIVVGAPSVDSHFCDFDCPVTSAGAVYVYTPDGASGYTETMLKFDPTEFGRFGRSVAIDGDTIVVAPPVSAPDDVAAHVFRPNGAGGHTGALLTGKEGDFFGRETVAIDGDTIAVGAYHINDNGGGVYVFRPDGAGGYDSQEILASDGTAHDFFGFAVDVHLDTIAVGAPFRDDAATDAGGVYVYTPDGSGGYHEARLTASDAAESDFLGVAVAVHDGVVVAGASLDERLVVHRNDHGDEDGSHTGSAYVLVPDGSGGYAETKLTASDASALDRFGTAVDIEGDTLVVGGYRGNDGTGAAYVFGSRVDADGDGVEDKTDNCPATPNPEQHDTDADGLGDACDPNDDNDGLPDSEEGEAGTDPTTSDSDGDGLDDGQDPDIIAAVVDGLDDSAFEGGGHHQAIDAHLAQIHDLIEQGRISLATQRLESLRTHVDGCDPTTDTGPDEDDWIVECDAQHDVRDRIDLLLTNLTA